jgi:hypothetical protein
MAFVVNDRVQEFTSTTGTGTLTLTGSPDGFETFSSAVGDGNTTYYTISSNTTEFEVGIGTVGAGTLSRDTVISSSNSDALVNFSAGTKNVFVTLPASKTILLNDSGTVDLTGNLDLNSNDITGTGNINITGNLTASGNLTSLGIDDNATSTAITIDSSENVGIGTASPNNQLEIKSDTATVVARLACNTGTGRDWGVASATDGAFGIYDYDATAYRMRIDSSGNVGIGTTSPDNILMVSSDGASASAQPLSIVNPSRYGASDSVELEFGMGRTNDTNNLNFPIIGLQKEQEWVGASSNVDASVIFKSVSNQTASEAMRILSSGNVGIGTSSPQYPLEVTGVTLINGNLVITGGTDTADRRASITHDGSSMILKASGNSTNRNIIFERSGDGSADETMRIDSSGNVGIGTSSPNNQLEIKSDTATVVARLACNTGTGRDWGVASATDGAFGIYDYDAAAYRMRIDSSGNVGIGTTSPDKLLTVASNSGTSVPTIRILDTNVSPTTNDVNGSLEFYTNDGDGEHLGAYISCIANEVYGRVNSLVFGVSQSITADATEALRIQSNGNVGINTTAPDAKLSVNGVASFGDGTALLPSIANFGNLNTGMWFPAADTIAFSEGGVEAMRIDSSGNVLVGKTAIALATVGGELRENGQITGTRDANASLILNRLNSDGDIAKFYKDGTNVGNIGVINSDNLYISGYTAHAGIQFGSETVAPMSAGVATNNTIDLGGSGNAYRDLYLGGGLYVGGTVAANKLDDYEEGTWTPTLTGASSNPTVSYTTQNGRYTKIGNTVTLYFQCFTSSVSGGTGRLRISGLPFTSNSNNKAGTALGYVSFVNLNAGYTTFSLVLEGSGAHLLGAQSGDNVSAIEVNVTEAGNAFNVVGTLSYFV